MLSSFMSGFFSGVFFAVFHTDAHNSSFAMPLGQTKNRRKVKSAAEYKRGSGLIYKYHMTSSEHSTLDTLHLK